MAKSIPLTKNKTAIVDDDDYLELSKYKWYYTSTGYAARKPSQGIIYMHRVITKCPADKFIDHKDFNRLNNTKDNLRICSKKENQRHQNKRKVKTSSKYKGVHFFKRDEVWVAQLLHKHLRRFKTEIEAAEAYNKEATKQFGKYAVLNKI